MDVNHELGQQPQQRGFVFWFLVGVATAVTAEHLKPRRQTESSVTVAPQPDGSYLIKQVNS